MLILRKTGLGVLLGFAAALMAGCASATALEAQDGDGRMQVVATTGMIADVVRNLVGDRLQVIQLMGAGIDPHLYSATESDVERLASADLLFYNGLNLEARMADIFEQMGDQIPVVAVGDRLGDEWILAEVRFNAPDPHLWMDVGRWIEVTRVIEAALEAFDPAGEAVYRSNANAYLLQLEELDRYIQEQIQRIPPEQRLLVTAHDAFQYYSQAYGIEVFAPQGITTESEASVEDIRQVIQVMVDRKIPAIFVESSVPPDVVEAIVEGAAAAGHPVEIGGQLFSDAMGELGTEQGTYLGMLRHNTDTIVSALMGP